MKNEELALWQSRDVKDYRSIFDGFVEDFGYSYYHTILAWCGLVSGFENDTRFWQVWLILTKAQTVGICGLYSLDSSTETLWLGWFGVLAQHRAKGIGGRVLLELESRAISAGCNKLSSYVDKAGGPPLPFYLKHGFTVSGKVNDFLGLNPTVKADEFEDSDDFIIQKQLQGVTE